MLCLEKKSVLIASVINKNNKIERKKEMEVKQVKVTSKKQLLETIDVEIFVSIEEAVEHYSGNEASVLRLINQQHKATKTNACRAKYTKPEGKKRLRSLAMQLVPKEEMDEAIASGDLNAFTAVLDKYVPEVEAKLASGEISEDDVLEEV